jgi:mevalonate pyrophosphate decarboxylase
VVFVIVTDGMENSSREFKKSTIKEMIERQKNVYNWHFNFLAANQDAFAEAAGLGVDAAGAANWAPAKAAVAYSSMSSKLARMRHAAQSGEEVDNEFTEEERRRML